MADPGQLRDGVVRDAVVRPLPHRVERPCARPSCAAPAAATLSFHYASREAWLEGLRDGEDPQAYDLCLTHAARTRAPQGWQLRDRRPEDERRPATPTATPVDLGGDRTVAVLAAALRSVPDPVSEDAIADHAEVDRAVAEPVMSAPQVPSPIDPETAAGLTAHLDPVVTPVDEPTPEPAPVATPLPPLVVRDRDAAAER